MNEILKELDLSDLPKNLLEKGQEFALLSHLRTRLIKYSKSKKKEDLQRIGNYIKNLLNPLQELDTQIKKDIAAAQAKEKQRLEKIRFSTLTSLGYNNPPVYLTEEQIKVLASAREPGMVYNTQLFDLDLSVGVSATELQGTLTRLTTQYKDVQVSASVIKGCSSCGDNSIALFFDREQTFDELCQEVYNEDREAKEAHEKLHEEWKLLYRKYKS